MAAVIITLSSLLIVTMMIAHLWNSAMLCLLLTLISELRWEKYQWARVLRDSLTREDIS